MLRRFRAAALGRRGESLPGCKPSNARRARRPGRCPLSISISPIPILARGCCCHVRPASPFPCADPQHAAFPLATPVNMPQCPLAPSSNAARVGGPPALRQRRRRSCLNGPSVTNRAWRFLSAVALSPSYARKRISAHPTLQPPPTAPSPLPPPARSNRKHYQRKRRPSPRASQYQSPPAHPSPSSQNANSQIQFSSITSHRTARESDDGMGRISRP